MAGLCRAALWVLASLLAGNAWAEPPDVAYIFPAGGQRGTEVPVRIGGFFLHDKASFEILGGGITGPAEIHRIPTVWFDGPVLKQPASQQAEDYPQDYTAQLAIARDALPGVRQWRVWNAQGITRSLPFVVGDLPEFVESEIDGAPLPTVVSLPVTINGRIFPRADVDLWDFDVAAGQTISCRVAAGELGSPLKARLEVRDPDGRPVAESIGDARGQVQLQFTAPRAGRYQAAIHDLQSQGLQHYVYRLTLTDGPAVAAVYPAGGRRGSETTLELFGHGTLVAQRAWRLPDATAGIVTFTPELDNRPSSPLLLDLDDLPEQLEAEPNEVPARAGRLVLPGVANGRIAPPGDSDRWSCELAAGQSVHVEVRAAQLGSLLAAVLVIRDATGKELARANWLDQNRDPQLDFQAPQAGRYDFEVIEQFPSRGGPEFTYRLRVTESAADFQLFAPADGLAVDLGGTKNFELKILRTGGMREPVQVHVAGLPAGVTCDDVTVAPNGDKAVLVFKAANGPVTTALLRITGQAEVQGAKLERIARVSAAPGQPVSDALRLVTTLKTPFKFRGVFDSRYTARGSLLRKSYEIDRGGYTGAFEVRMADKQGRHLQGVTGPVVSVPPGKDSFDYTLYLPPWMELGRTSRTNLMLTGELPDGAGTLHKVCFTTREQNEQLIALVAPAPLQITSTRSSFALAPNTETEIPLEIKRDRSLDAVVQLELVVPSHMRDISASPVTVAADTATTVLRIRTGPVPGPLNMPLLIRGTAQASQAPLVAELPIEAVPAAPHGSPDP